MRQLLLERDRELELLETELRAREHARCADLPVDEIVASADTVVVRPDPAPATA